MKNDRIKIGATVTVALCLFVIVFGQRSVCPIRGLTGLPCPGCGMTRALFLAFSLRFAQAFSYHPLWILIPPFAIYILYKYFKGERINSRIIAFAGVLFVGVYIFRMVLFFPHTEPMTFNSEALYLRLYDLIMRGVYGK